MTLIAKPSLAVGLVLLASLAGQTYATCSANIQLVRPDTIYEDNHDGTVTDTNTGLVWAKCSLGQSWVENTPGDSSDDQCSGTLTPLTWKGAQEAAQSANSSNYLGLSDWRVPNSKELGSLVEVACINPAINTSLFPSTPPGLYWTSSPYTRVDYEAWVVTFYDGTSGGSSKKYDRFVRVVRGGQ